MNGIAEKTKEAQKEVDVMNQAFTQKVSLLCYQILLQLSGFVFFSFFSAAPKLFHAAHDFPWSARALAC